MAAPVLTLQQFTNVMEAIQPGSSQYPQGMQQEYAQYQKNPEQYANTLPGAGASNNDISQRFNSYSALVQGQGQGQGTATSGAAAQQDPNSGYYSFTGGSGASSGGGNSMDPQIQTGGVDDQTAIDAWKQAAIAAGDTNPGNIDAATAQQWYAEAHPQAVDNTQPETRALQQLQQIDPTSEALRQNLGQSYLNTLSQAPTPSFTPGQAPSASDIQGYLNLYKQIDPTGYQQHADLATGMNSYLSQVQQQAALGATLDPSTQREVSQAARQAQAARGNVYGTPQLVQETMQRGSAGQALLQQRLANLGSALGQQQGYLQSGTGLGDVANTLYNQGFSRNLSQYQQQLAALNQAQQSSQGYLGSGTTPYQAGASYLSNAEQNAASAAQGGPQYNPSSLSPGMTGTSQQAPQYGLDIGAQGQNYYSAMGYQNMMQPQSQNNTGAYIGAAANIAGSLAKAYTGSPAKAV